MSDANAIAVRISADASGFRRGAEDAERHVDALSDRLKEFRTHVRTETRYTKFLADQIGNLGVVSEGAAGAVGHLVAGFAFGGGLGVAIASAKVIVEAIHSIGEESAKESEAFKKLAEDSKKFIEAQAQALEDFLAALEGDSEAQNIARKEALPLLAQETTLTGKLAEVREHLAAINANVDENGMVADVVALNKATKEEIDLQAKLGLVQADLAAVRKRVGGTGAGSDAAEEKKATAALNEEILRLNISHRIEDAADDQRRRKQMYDVALADTQKLLEEQFAIEEQFRNRNDLDEIASAAHFQEVQRQKYDEALKETSDFFDQQDRDAKKEADKLAHHLGQAALQMGEAAGQAFLGMIEGTKSVEDALTQLVAQMVEAALRMAALRELASGDFIGAGLLSGAAVIAGGIGSLTGGGGGNTNLTVNNTFHGTQNASEVSLAMERSAMNVIRRMQSRGRFT